MSTVKIVETPKEIYWSVTYEGTLEIDGVEVGYRFHEDSNGVEIFVYEDGEGWTSDPSESLAETYDVLYELLTEFDCTELGNEGEEFEFDEEE